MIYLPRNVLAFFDRWHQTRAHKLTSCLAVVEAVGVVGVFVRQNQTDSRHLNSFYAGGVFDQEHQTRAHKSMPWAAFVLFEAVGIFV